MVEELTGSPKVVSETIFDLIKKSSDPLTPIIEALNNSIEATRSTSNSDSYTPIIKIVFEYIGSSADDKIFSSFVIEDNGEGFNEVNFNRFEIFGDKSKGYKNRGTGRVQFLHFFEDVSVESVFEEEGDLFRINFDFDKSLEVRNKIKDVCVDDCEAGSKITLKRFKGDKNDFDFFNALNADKIKAIFLRRYILKFYLDKESDDIVFPNIEFLIKFNGTECDKCIIDESCVIDPEGKGNFSVSYKEIHWDDEKSSEFSWENVSGKSEVFEWVSFKVPKIDGIKNEVWLCSKDVLVKSIGLPKVSKTSDVNGFFCLAAVTGDVLNDERNVSHSVDDFNFPSKKDVESQLIEGDLFYDDKEFLFIEDIERGIKREIPHIFKGFIEEQDKFDQKVSLLAEQLGISQGIAKVTKLKLTDTDEVISQKLLKKQAEIIAPKAVEIIKKYEELKTLNPTDENYQSKLLEKSKDILNLIPAQNMEELSRYVIRREMVADILGKIINNELDYQNDDSINRKDSEGLVHDLIFKRKSNDTETLNDLWILDEDFLYFEGCSEIQLRKIKLSDGRNLLSNLPDELPEEFKPLLEDSGDIGGKRPDIFLYPAEGKCILIEFKSNDVDLSSHLNQLIKYSQIIANFGQVKIDKFYCYLLGGKIDYLGLDSEYHETVNGDFVRPNARLLKFGTRTEIASCYLEVTKLSSLYERAKRRNRSFAEKLKLRFMEDESGH